jgi:hypothetical protein
MFLAISQEDEKLALVHPETQKKQQISIKSRT